MSGTSGTGGSAGTPASGSGAATAGANPPTTTTDVDTTLAGAGGQSLAQYLAKALPVVQHHLEQAQQLEQRLAK
jgi:hypothetical protein